MLMLRWVRIEGLEGLWVFGCMVLNVYMFVIECRTMRMGMRRRRRLFSLVFLET